MLQVGNETIEKNSWTRPEHEATARPAYYTSTYNGTSDLAGQLSAALSSSALVFQHADSAYSTQLLHSARDLYAAGARNRATYTYSFNYPCAEDQLQAPGFPGDNPRCLPADELFQGAMIGTYNSTSYYDDLAWGAAWLFKATGDPYYGNQADRCVVHSIIGTATVFVQAASLAHAPCSAHLPC